MVTDDLLFNRSFTNTNTLRSVMRFAMKSANATILDLSILPEQARQEVSDFYQFLARKYRTKKALPIRDPGIKQFFKQYQLDMGHYRFDRDEANER